MTINIANTSLEMSAFVTANDMRNFSIKVIMIFADTVGTATAKLETDYSAQQLLKKLQDIEVKLGRENPHSKNHPRTIDLDILLYGDLTIDKDNLKIPHPQMWKREFVTVPLKEIAPELFKQYSAYG